MNTKDFKEYGSIRTKILLRLAINVLVLILLVFSAFYFIIAKSYFNIEKDQTIQNLQRANDALDSLSIQLASKLADWAFWDDTYEFVLDVNNDYIKSNLGVASITTLKINAMLFVNNSGEIVFSKMIDLNDSTEVSSDDLEAHILENKMLLSHESEESVIRGIIMLSGKPMLLASRPILASSAMGPAHGTLIFAKYLDAEEVATISDLTHLSFNVYVYGSTSIPEDVAVAK